MAETPAISDRNLEASTNISLKREPACFAFLSARSVAPPMPINSINLDLASADYFGGRASLWTTLEMRSSVNNDRPTAILGFDETFLRPFARALVEAATTRASYRMTILTENRDNERCRVVEYVTGPGKPLKELVLQPFDNVVLISATTPKDSDETLFQLPRTDSFLRAFAKMAYTADQASARSAGGDAARRPPQQRGRRRPALTQFPASREFFAGGAGPARFRIVDQILARQFPGGGTGYSRGTPNREDRARTGKRAEPPYRFLIPPLRPARQRMAHDCGDFCGAGRDHAGLRAPRPLGVQTTMAGPKGPAIAFAIRFAARRSGRGIRVRRRSSGWRTLRNRSRASYPAPRRCRRPAPGRL